MIYCTNIIQKASEPKQKGETTLFGALTNNHSRSLDMTLALPEICQQPSSITFNSGAKLKLVCILDLAFYIPCQMQTIIAFEKELA